MQTHKNQNLRADGVVRSAGSGGLTSTPKAPVSKPPVFSRDGKKWLVVKIYGETDKNAVYPTIRFSKCILYIFWDI